MNELEELQNRIDKISNEIKHREQMLISDFMKSLLPNKCDHCNGIDNIHRTDCYYMSKYWNYKQ